MISEKLVSGGDAAEFFELAEEIFDQMPPLVRLEVARDGGDPVDFEWYHGDRASIVQVGADPVAVESLVRQKRAEIE
jgi:hypothetical protein